MAALCIYFISSVVYHFGSSGDMRDTVAVVSERPPGQQPIGKENMKVESNLTPRLPQSQTC